MIPADVTSNSHQGCPQFVQKFTHYAFRISTHYPMKQPIKTCSKNTWVNHTQSRRGKHSRKHPPPWHDVITKHLVASVLSPRFNTCTLAVGLQQIYYGHKKGGCTRAYDHSFTCTHMWKSLSLGVTVQKMEERLDSRHVPNCTPICTHTHALPCLLMWTLATHCFVTLQSPCTFYFCSNLGNGNVILALTNQI